MITPPLGPAGPTGGPSRRLAGCLQLRAVCCLCRPAVRCVRPHSPSFRSLTGSCAHSPFATAAAGGEGIDGFPSRPVAVDFDVELLSIKTSAAGYQVKLVEG